MGIRGLIPKGVKRFVRKQMAAKPAQIPPDSTVPQIWSIGIYEGTSLVDLKPAKKAENPVLQAKDVWDVPAHFVADPFMIREGKMWYMFFEVLNAATGRGEIGLAKSNDGYRWKYEKIVLKEPFHLSYPYVFEHDGHHYMIPETSQTKTVRIYKAIDYPYEWEFIDTLISGRTFSDASLLHHNNKWWIFTETSPNRKFDTLRLYMADELFGPWGEHPGSSLINDNPHTARPSGRIFTVEGRLIRLAQDCAPTYGLHVNAFEITELSDQHYREKPLSRDHLLTKSGSGWNEAGMHHADIHPNGSGSLIASVDGWRPNTI